MTERDRQTDPCHIHISITTVAQPGYSVEVCMIRKFPWESHGNGKPRLNSWEWEREWEWWTGNRNSRLEEIPVSRVNHIFGIIFLQRATVDVVESRWFASLPHNVSGWPVSVILTCLLIYLHTK